MNLIDLIIIALLGYGLIKGYKKGLIIELSSFFGVFIAFFISINLDDIISRQILELININFDILNIIVFILTFLLSYSAIIFIVRIHKTYEICILRIIKQSSWIIIWRAKASININDIIKDYF